MFEDDRLLRELTQLHEKDLPAAERDARRSTLLAESNAIAEQKRKLLDDRARRLADVLPVGRVRTAAEIQATLQPGELFLEFTHTDDASLLYAIGHDRAVEAFELPTAVATAKRVLPALLRHSSRAAFNESRGIGAESPPAATIATADSRELFASLFPSPVWERIRTSKRVFVAAHRALHRLPFELLVVDQKDGKPVLWLDAGPPVSYVPSGSALHWLRTRKPEQATEAAPISALVVGDPRLDVGAPALPEQGVLVRLVNADGEGARAGLQPDDVLMRYDGKPLVDDATLHDLRTAVDAAIQEGKRPTAPIPVDVWRHGSSLRVEVAPGRLGIQVAQGKARDANEANLDRGGGAIRFVHKSDLERIARLPQLAGAHAEAEAIATAFRAAKTGAELLLGERATESAVFDLAAKAKYVHFACHGVSEEYAGQSLSMLVLTQPQHVLPEDDGLLKLGDLLNTWSGRLSSCRLVVLSACRTNVGPTYRDDAPQALPTGFLFAGVPSVMSTLWPVDDASTKELMTDFYGRLLAGETDKLAAFTAAKQTLRKKYPDPFHWAPFLFLGAPE